MTYPGQSKILVLACAVMEREILSLSGDSVDCRFFDYGLHRSPENMAGALQVEIDKAAKMNFHAILLGYGLCSNGIVGIRSRKQPIVVPFVHDCIALFLGSNEIYKKQIAEHPGTYYLTSGWIEKGETLLSKYQDYSRSYGPQEALGILREEMKNYTRLALIDTDMAEADSDRKIALQNASLLALQYEEIKGSISFFKNLLLGPWTDNFIVLTEGQVLSQEMFFPLGEAP